MPSCVTVPNPLDAVRALVGSVWPSAEGSSSSSTADEDEGKEVMNSADRPLSKCSHKHLEPHGHPVDLPEADEKKLVEALEALVEHSAHHTDLGQGIYATSQNLWAVPWLGKLIPGIEDLANDMHLGNFVVVRSTKERIFEFMPLYTRVGMHLLFYGRIQQRLLDMKWLEGILREQSIKQGKIYDSPESAAAIPSFVATYDLNLEELLEPDIKKYKCFNDFFYRKLKPNARPAESADDPSVLSSAADCRLTVYDSFDLATKFWVKGNDFDIPDLLRISATSDVAKSFVKTGPASVAIFRLAPQDYHRFHCPLDATMGDITNIPGEYYTVNPQAVNQEDFDVLTANVRSVLYMTHKQTGLPVAFVAVGALLVGSIKWTAGAEKGKEVKRGEELGYFAYGGSTVVAVFAHGVIEFDEDLRTLSQEPIEALVKVGSSIGKTPKRK